MNQELQNLLDMYMKHLKPLRDMQYDNFVIAESVLYGKDVSRDDRFVAEQLMAVMEPLDQAANRILRLTRPVKAEGKMRKLANGRYALGDDELTAGSAVEALLYNGEDDEVGYWYFTRIEHDGEDYYLVGKQDQPMQGLTARLR